jgi:hypothetical protein
VVNLVQSVLNNSLSTRLNNRTSMKVFTGHAETTPLALILKDNAPVNVPLDRGALCSAARTNVVVIVMLTITVV